MNEDSSPKSNLTFLDREDPLTWRRKTVPFGFWEAIQFGPCNAENF